MGLRFLKSLLEKKRLEGLDGLSTEEIASKLKDLGVE